MWEGSDSASQIGHGDVTPEGSQWIESDSQSVRRKPTFSRGDPAVLERWWEGPRWTVHMDAPDVPLRPRRTAVRLETLDGQKHESGKTQRGGAETRGRKCSSDSRQESFLLPSAVPGIRRNRARQVGATWTATTTTRGSFSIFYLNQKGTE